jgi:hypothetical protein
VDWEAIRAEYEAEAGFRALAAKHGISHTAVRKRVIGEGWSQDMEPIIQRKVTEQVSGVVSDGNPTAAELLAKKQVRRSLIQFTHGRGQWLCWLLGADPQRFLQRINLCQFSCR